MKHYLKLFASAFICAFVVQSCQTEEHETTENPETLNKSSELTKLLSRVSSHATALDNAIDSTSCFSINLPFQVMTTAVGPITTIDSEDDYLVIEDFYANNPNANVELVFPVTVTFADYSTAVANNDAEFNILQMQCDFVPVDPVASCFSINYPITIFTYDSNSQVADTYVINNDVELYLQLLGLTATEVYSIDFPISAINAGGETITISNNSELFDAIETALADCGGVNPTCSNPEILTDSLVLYIPFANETVDLIGYSTPAISGNYHYVTDRSGHANGAFSFDDEANNGENIIQTYQVPAGNLMQNNNFTLSLWFNRQNNNPAVTHEQLINSVVTVLSLGNATGMGVNGNMGPWTVGGGGGVQDPSWIAENLQGDIGQWHHVVVTYQGSQNLMSLYRDGVLRGTYTTLPGMPETVLGISFGNAFKGFIDDIRGYKYALSASEVNTLYNLQGDVNTCMHQN